MKITELKFKNLNSLYGEWSIDFNSPEYSSNGIFALTGPTGAGKSTVLDAICLALYGRTPRLGAVTAGGNEIMSRQTGECSSEVVFETREGKFRCSWEQHRAYSRPEGKLADPKHEISDAVTGKIIENKKSLVGNAVEKKTGMDYERFTRSILLAQGGFDTFLNAETGQKSRILEQITGTDIYTEISVKVHEKRKEENDKLALLKGISREINVLSPDEAGKYEKDLETKKEEEQNISERTEKTGRRLEKLIKVNELEKEIADLKDKYKNLKNEKESFHEEKMQLEKALKASVFDGDYASLKSRREVAENNINDLKEESSKLPAAEELYGNCVNNFKKAESELSEIKKKRKDLAEIIVKVRLLDQEIFSTGKRIKNLETELEKITKDINELEKVKEELIKKLDNTASGIKYAEEYLALNAADGELESTLSGIAEKINSASLKNIEIKKSYEKRKEISENMEMLNEKYTAAQKSSEQNSKLITEIDVKIDETGKDLEKVLKGRELKEYRKEKEYLLKQKNLVDIIIKLESEREKLEDGKPCPLCGSADHPYAAGNIPEKDDVEKQIEAIDSILKKADERTELYDKYEKEKNSAAKSLSESDKTAAVLKSEKTSSEKEFKNISDDITDKEEQNKKLLRELSLLLVKYGINNFSIENASSSAELLEKRLNDWKKQKSEKEILEKSLTEIKNEIKTLETSVKTLSASFSEKKSECETLYSELEKTVSERKKLFSDKNCDEEEQKSDSLISEAENKLTDKREEKDRIIHKLNTIKTIIENLEKKVEEDKPVLEKMEKDFIQKITSAGFKDEDDFEESRIDRDERERLMEKGKELDKKEAEIKTGLNDREKRLESEASELTGERSREKVSLEYEEYKSRLKQLIDEIALIRHKLEENAASGKRLEEKQKEIEKQTAECAKWDKLHSYIGSADGKKYREFAQGITFEIMVSHANRQITKMTDRYILLRSSETPLELNVADNYQAGEIRSVKNLSGGESFIVSLALALGLSKMAGRKVRVDSLFLDEGFGTLDEDALETALETLSSLQQDGKLIGIISHVPALKERITTQISVNPVSGGKSRITGPGCRAAW